MTEVIRMKNKTKINMEYSKNSVGFDHIDLDKVVVNVFLKNGTRIYHDNIEQITIKANDKEDD